MRGLLLFLTGALAGAAATVLYTTEKGEDVRERIKTLLMRRGIIAPDEVDEFIAMVTQQIED